MHKFDRDMSMIRQGPLRLKVNISDDWSVNGTPNGGYLMAVAANAMLHHTKNKSTPILTANYISRCAPGEAVIDVEEIYQSTQFSRLQARLFQDGKERVRMLGTFALERDVCFLERYEALPPEIVPPEKCFPLPELSSYTIFSNLDLRLDPAYAGWLEGNLREYSETKGWIKFKRDRDFDMLSIPLAADGFPPAVLSSQGMVSWVPTIEFSVNIRNIPQTKWLKGIFRTQFISCGLLEEDGELWDEKGNLIAISRQIAQFDKTRSGPVQVR